MKHPAETGLRLPGYIRFTPNRRHWRGGIAAFATYPNRTFNHGVQAMSSRSMGASAASVAGRDR